MSLWTALRDRITAIVQGQTLSEALTGRGPAPERSVDFTIAVIALAAKMAKADGRVTRDEIAAFRDIFTIPPEEEAHAARVYNLARGDVAGFEAYAAKVADLFADAPETRADLLEGLVYIAAADGHYHPAEQAFLERVAEIFGVGATEFRAIRARHLPGESDPWAVLGLEPGASMTEVKTRHRQLVRELHPDALAARGVPEEARRMAERRFAAVNAAVSEIQSENRD